MKQYYGSFNYLNGQTVLKSLGEFTDKILKKSSIAVTDQIIYSSSVLIINLILMHMLGVRGYGQYVLLWTPVLIVLGIQTGYLLLPMRTIGPKQSDGNANAYYLSAWANQFLLSGIVFAVFFAAAFAFPQQRAVALPFGMVAATTLTHEFSRHYYFSLEKPHMVLCLDLLGSFSQLLILALGYWYGHWTLNAIFCVMFATSLCAILVAWFKKPHEGTIRFHWSELKAFAKRNLAFSSWVTSAAILLLLNTQITQLVLGFILGPVAVAGVYSLQMLNRPLVLLMQSFENLLSPRWAKAIHEFGKATLFKSALQLFVCMFFIYACYTLGLVLFGKAIMARFFGDHFAFFAKWLHWQMLLTLMIMTWQIVQMVILTLELGKAYFIQQIVLIPLSFMVLIFSLKTWGISGVYVASGVLYCGNIILGLTNIKRAACQNRQYTADEGTSYQEEEAIRQSASTLTALTGS